VHGAARAFFPGQPSRCELFRAAAKEFTDTALTRAGHVSNPRAAFARLSASARTSRQNSHEGTRLRWRRACSITAVADTPRLGAPFRRPLANLALLLVEDETDVREILARGLRQSGAAVVSLGSACEAHEFFRCGGSVDAVIADVNLPDMNGLVLAAGLRRSLPGLPIVLMSGDPANAGLASHTPDRMHYLHKPFDPTVMIDAVLASMPSRTTLPWPAWNDWQD
jgi:CheY-like chemotaxis protein